MSKRQPQPCQGVPTIETLHRGAQLHIKYTLKNIDIYIVHCMNFPLSYILIIMKTDRKTFLNIRNHPQCYCSSFFILVCFFSRRNILISHHLVYSSCSIFYLHSTFLFFLRFQTAVGTDIYLNDLKDKFCSSVFLIRGDGLIVCTYTHRLPLMCSELKPQNVHECKFSFFLCM